MARAPGAAAQARPRGTLGFVVRGSGGHGACARRGSRGAAGEGRESAEGERSREWGRIKNFYFNGVCRLF